MLRAAFPCPPPTQLRERPNMAAAAAAPRAPWRGGHGGRVPRGPRRTARRAGRTRGRGTPGSEASPPGPGGAAGTSTPSRQRGAPRAAPSPLRERGLALVLPHGGRAARDGGKPAQAPGGTGSEMGLEGPAVPYPPPRAFGPHRPPGLTHRLVPSGTRGVGALVAADWGRSAPVEFLK